MPIDNAGRPVQHRGDLDDAEDAKGRRVAAKDGNLMGRLKGLLLNGVQLKEYFVPGKPPNPALAKMHALHCEPEIFSSNISLPALPRTLFISDNPECITGKPRSPVTLTVKLCGERSLTLFTSGIGTMGSGHQTSSTYVSYSTNGTEFTQPALVRGPGIPTGKANSPYLPRRYVRYINVTSDPKETISVCSFSVAPISILPRDSINAQ
jgi:hypothetical protein